MPRRAAQAQDAADLVAVEYDELPAVTDLKDAMKPGAPQLHAEAPGNLALDWPGMIDSADNEREIDDIIKKARACGARLGGQPAPGRGVDGDARLECLVRRQDRDAITCAPARRAPAPCATRRRRSSASRNDKLQVTTEDVGGAFGMKTPVYPEYLGCLVAAKKIGRPVAWQSTRAEAFMTDTQGRDTVTDAELALDDTGKFLALRMHHFCSQGAYITPAGVGINTNNVARCLPGMYRIPKIVFTTTCVFSNTAPIGPYRGAGRPEANYALDRVVEEAARITGIDTARLRKKNLIPKSAMPYKTAVTTTYDSGDFPGAYDKAMELSDYKNFSKRKREAARRKKLRGIGISCMLEHAGAQPTEGAMLTFPGGETLLMSLNVQSTGQAHATVFGRLLADKLGIDRRHIVHRHGDFGLRNSGLCLGRLTLGHDGGQRRHAQCRGDAGEGQEGRRRCCWKRRRPTFNTATAISAWSAPTARISLFETARRAKEMSETLDTKEKTDTPLTFPNGVHIAEVEIDPDTGALDIVSYTAVDDCGNMLNPMVVEGQMQGSFAQGLGQALLENTVYDAGGQLVTGSFMDYAMPRAHHMPIEWREANHACRRPRIRSASKAPARPAPPRRSPRS